MLNVDVHQAMARRDDLPDMVCALQHMSGQGASTGNLVAGSRSWEYQNVNDPAHVIGPKETLEARVPTLCVRYEDPGRSFSKNLVQNFLPMTGSCQT